jgi:hypothetical protein
METVIKELENLLKGKTFVYKSKYGRTQGVVESVHAMSTFILDEDSEKKLSYRVNHSVKGDKTMEKPELKGTSFYMASRPDFRIVSTNGITYDYTECFFITNEEDEGSF